MIATADGYVLQKGSCIHKNPAESLSNGIKNKVEESRNNGEIKDGILQNDKLFSSSSAAAAFATGYSISGPQQWKMSNGTTLKSFELNNKHRKKALPTAKVSNAFYSIKIIVPANQ